MKRTIDLRPKRRARSYLAARPNLAIAWSSTIKNLDAEDKLFAERLMFDVCHFMASRPEGKPLPLRA
jgi:hypothetical protein